MSGNDTRIDSLFDRFGAQPSAQQETRWLEMGGKVPYQAVELAAPGMTSQTLRVYFSNGNVASIRYSTVAAVLYEAADHNLGLLTRSGAFVLKGENLLSLLDDLERERVKVVRFFDDQKHAPPGEGAVILTRITWMATK